MLNAVIPSVEWVGDDTADQIAVSRNGQPIPFLENSFIRVTKIVQDATDTVLTEGDHYTLAGGPSAGVITRTAGNLPIGTTWLIERRQPINQDSDFVTGAGIDPKKIGDALDKGRQISQELGDAVERYKSKAEALQAMVGQISGYVTAAEDALTAIETLADQFDDTFLGFKASDPELDNDGDALVDGQWYWNTASKNHRVYDGTSWDDFVNPSFTTSWGSIQGTLGSQSDLQAALDDKAASSHNHAGAYQPLDAETLLADTNDNLTAGYTATADDDGTKSSGTYTPDPAGGNLKRIISGGAFTLEAPTATGDYTIVIQVTNNASAGTVTISGFESETGDSLSTTDGDDFFLFITKINGLQSLHITALQ